MKLFSKLKSGLKDLTPEQQIKAQYIGAAGQAWGFALACISLIVKQFIVYNWTVTFFIIVLIFAVLTTGTQAKALKQQLDAIKKSKEELDKYTESGL